MDGTGNGFAGWSEGAVATYVIVKVLIVVSLVIVWRKSERRRRLVRSRMEKRVRFANPDPRYALDPKSAIVIHERTTTSGAGKDAYEVFHRILRNTHGQYFLHIYSPEESSSYVEYLPRDRAMNALRDDPIAFRKEFGEQAASAAAGPGISWPF